MLLVFGSINIDFVFPLPFLPNAGDTVWSGGGGRTEPGGKGANQAIAAVRDGARVTLAGAVGEDVLADAAVAGLKQAGVKLHVARVPGLTGRAAISIDPQGYTMIAVDAGANRLASADQVPDAMLGPRTTLLVQLETDPAQVSALVLRARGRGCRIIVNPSPSRPIGMEALRAADLLIGNNHEIAWLGNHVGTGNNPASLHAALGVATVRMMGEQGAEAMSDAGFLHMPALPVHVRDTTGAADCFTGVLAAALSGGADLPRALRRAAVAAALSTTHTGAQGSMPQARDIDAALQGAPQVTGRQPELAD